MSAFQDSIPADVEAAARAAHAAFASFGSSSAATRASLLRALADALEANREPLVKLADEETHLGTARLNGELTRTAYQAEFFASVVEDGGYLEATIDHAAGSRAVRSPGDRNRRRLPRHRARWARSSPLATGGRSAAC